MSYYRAFGLHEEPFSTSPDPDFFYESVEHKEPLLRLEIAIKLRRGACLVLGDVGTGKTTLARKLYGIFSDRSKYDFGMVLDPTWESEEQFLTLLMDVFDVKSDAKSPYDRRKALERHLFQRGVDEGRTVILLVDEAQKLNPQAMEILRTLLNYETSKHKLLQLVIMGQMELLPVIREIKNFWDRIALKYMINPLSERETREMIEFRLRQAGHPSSSAVFSQEAVEAIYNHTQGCPRRVTMMAHDGLETAVMKNKATVDKEDILGLIADESGMVRHGV